MIAGANANEFYKMKYLWKFIFATSYSRENKRMQTFLIYSIIFLSHKTIWKLYFLAYQAREHQYESCGLLQKMSREASNSTRTKPLNACHTVSNIRNYLISDRFCIVLYLAAGIVLVALVIAYISFFLNVRSLKRVRVCPDRIKVIKVYHIQMILWYL